MTSVDRDTIAAVATAPGRAGVGIVRVSGEALRAFAAQLTRSEPVPRYATRARFYDAQGDLIDDGLLLYFPGPHSYTGQDVIEIQGHGSPAALRLLMRRCLELGARPAEPGEFTRRAFLNGKLDLAQAEAVADLIDASTESAARGAARSLRGDFSAFIRDMLEQLIELRMLVEAGLDFPEEDIEPQHRADARSRLDRLLQTLERTLAAARQGSLLRTGMQVVLAGAPNVGKSSLLNRLAGEELAIVTPLPGTTRDAIRQIIQIEGVPFNIVDTAGLRSASDEVERMGIERSWREIGEADVLLLVIEAGAESEDPLKNRNQRGAKRVVVHNKIDLHAMPPTSERVGEDIHVFVSAKSGDGLPLLRGALLEAAGWREDVEDVFTARARHLQALERAQRYLQAAGKVESMPELYAEELRGAQKALGEITGAFDADDLLGAIFSRFCIGK